MSWLPAFFVAFGVATAIWHPVIAFRCMGVLNVFLWTWIGLAEAKKR